MTLKRPTIETVKSAIAMGDFPRAADVAKTLEPESELVALLAAQLAAIGNRKPEGGAGRKAKQRVRLLAVDGVSVRGDGPSTWHELVAAMMYGELMHARDVVDGHADGDVSAAKEKLRKWKLHKVLRQQFRTQLRATLCARYELTDKKIRQLIPKKP